MNLIISADVEKEPVSVKTVAIARSIKRSRPKKPKMPRAKRTPRLK